MLLIVMRHAEALSKEEDPYRALSEFGKIDSNLIGRFIKRAQMDITTIYHSPKLRSKQTAEIVADCLSLNDKIEQLACLDAAADFKDLRKGIEDLSENSLIVGHLPNVGLLSDYLLGKKSTPASALHLPTASAACFTNEMGYWALQWLIEPSLLIDTSVTASSIYY